jgi:hypothetical protein
MIPDESVLVGFLPAKKKNPFSLSSFNADLTMDTMDRISLHLILYIISMTGGILGNE